jgi:hypothetical protein
VLKKQRERARFSASADALRLLRLVQSNHNLENLLRGVDAKSSAWSFRPLRCLVD